MGLFKKKSGKKAISGITDPNVLAQRALDFIQEGVMLVDDKGMIVFANPAAAAMTGYEIPDNITGLDFTLVMRLENADESPVESTQSHLYTAVMTNKPLNYREYLLISAQTEKRIAVDLTCIPTGGPHDYRIINIRDITTELAEENEQAEFISTASHEMRTPVASIEGYLGLALNPQTATIDERAHQYLEAAHAASQHLGHLFKDLLDVTKLDDKRVKAHLVPVDAVEVVKQIADAHAGEMAEKHLKYSFGTNEVSIDKKRLEPKVYMAVDIDFLKEIIDNLVGNAIKYTPEGGEIWVNARGDGDKVLINVTDTGIGVSAEDAAHIFQKFYRVDNSQTRQIGGTGLGLYLVKQRVETLGGRVWVESAFGDGSTFFVSLPRLSDSEYEKMSIAHANEQMVQNFSAPNMTMTPNGMMATEAPTPVVTAVPAQPVATGTITSVSPTGTQTEVVQSTGSAQPVAGTAGQPATVSAPTVTAQAAASPVGQVPAVQSPVPVVSPTTAAPVAQNPAPVANPVVAPAIQPAVQPAIQTTVAPAQPAAPAAPTSPEVKTQV